MTETIIPYGTKPNQEGKPHPLEFITTGEVVENPTTGEIVDEINLVVISPIRAIRGLLKNSDDTFIDPESCRAIIDVLFVALNQWERLSKHLEAEYDLYDAKEKIKRLEYDTVKLLEKQAALLEERSKMLDEQLRKSNEGAPRDATELPETETQPGGN